MKRHANRLDRQRGAALVVGLILLMVLTVLAISVMRTATLELTMAGNAQFRENAFQLAESGIQAIIRSAEAGTTNLDAVGDCPAKPVPPRPWTDAELAWSSAVEVPALGGRYQTRLCFDGTTVDMPGSTIGRFRQLHYRIESRGRTDQRNAEAIHAQGFYRQVEE
jgi:type IV pilus assembly protein PilX